MCIYLLQKSKEVTTLASPLKRGFTECEQIYNSTWVPYIHKYNSMIQLNGLDFQWLDEPTFNF